MDDDERDKETVCCYAIIGFSKTYFYMEAVKHVLIDCAENTLNKILMKHFSSMFCDYCNNDNLVLYC